MLGGHGAMPETLQLSGMGDRPFLPVLVGRRILMPRDGPGRLN